jgi:hypothetical protein
VRKADSDASEAVQFLRQVYESLPGHLSDAARIDPFPDGLNYIRFKLELTGIGSIELELSGKPKALGHVASSDLYEEAAPFAGLPCTPANETAKKIMQNCDDVFEKEQFDCNKFMKAAASPFFGDIFKGLDADGIIALLGKESSGWTMTTVRDTCVAKAQAGHFVIAGMTAADLGQNNGHLAVVIACPQEASGTTTVPIGYAGSIGAASARIRGARLSGTFPKQKVWDEEISYFYKAPTI